VSVSLTTTHDVEPGVTVCDPGTPWSRTENQTPAMRTASDNRVADESAKCGQPACRSHSILGPAGGCMRPLLPSLVESLASSIVPPPHFGCRCTRGGENTPKSVSCRQETPIVSRGCDTWRGTGPVTGRPNPESAVPALYAPSGRCSPRGFLPASKKKPRACRPRLLLILRQSVMRSF
jgi:hypothetical protein